jgi:UDP-N-acetylglucosamine 2-epimerase
MELSKIKELREEFDRYLNYKGINLWLVSETSIFTHFLNKPKKIKAHQKLKHRLMRYAIKRKNSQREGATLSPASKETGTDKIAKTSEIIFLVSAASHVATLLPVIKKMGFENVKIVKHDRLSSDITKEHLEKNKLSYTDIDSYIDEEIKQELKKSEGWLGEQFSKIKKDVELKEKIGEDYQHVISALEYFMKTRKRFVETIRLIELVNKMYEVEKNKVVVLAEDNHDLGRSAALVARKKQIKSLVVQHGLNYGNPIFNEVIADKMAVFGEKEKQHLVDGGADSEKIVVTGQPRFDEITMRKRNLRNESCRKFGLDDKKKIIIFGAQPPQSQVIINANIEFVETINQIINSGDERFEFVVKLHPRMEKEDFPALPENVKVFKEVNLYDLFDCCDLLVTCYSTVGLEAVFLGCPCISIEIGERLGSINYGKEGVGHTVYEEGELRRAIEKVLSESEFRNSFERDKMQFIRNFAYRLDGRSTQRIVDLISLMKMGG